MAYLNIDPDFPDHPKTRRLVGLVGGNAEGLLVRLWCFIAKYHGDSGRLAGYTSQEIEAVVRWDGVPGLFVDSLCTLGWLHKNQDGYQVHDWTDHQGHIGALKVRAKKGAQARWDKLKEDNNASSNAQASLKQCSLPSLSLPSQKINDKDMRQRRSVFVRPSVEQIGEYCKERRNGIIPQQFFDHYESNGWRVGKNHMKDWMAAVRTWERNTVGNIINPAHQPMVPVDPEKLAAKNAEMQRIRDREWERKQALKAVA